MTYAAKTENNPEPILRSARRFNNPQRGETMMTRRILFLVTAMGMSMAVANGAVAVPLPQSQQDKMQSHDKMKNDKMKDNKMAGNHMKSHDKMAMQDKKQHNDKMKHDTMSDHGKMDHPQQ
jgi:pentapeptide MXKDX repeat protein